MKGINLSFELKNGFPTVLAEPREFGVLGMFLSVWNNSKEIRETLIPYVDERIEKGRDQIIDNHGTVHVNTFEADPLAEAVIDREVTVITNWDDSNDKCELSTKEFKEIIMKWLEFLESQ